MTAAIDPQMELDFEPWDAEPEEQEPGRPEPEPARKPGAFWNGHIWVSDDDLGF